ncbi:MAG: YrzI family small protein [Bacillota bacterium]|nr:YrzI family small protein [Bacillota bacterium]
MTLNILFLTITIRKRQMNIEQVMQHEMAHKLYEEHKNRSISVFRVL